MPAIADVVVVPMTQYVPVATTVFFASVLIFVVWRRRSRATTRARDWLQRRDPSAVVFVCARPSTLRVLDRYSTAGSPVRLPALFPVVVDVVGVSYFSTDRTPVPLASIPWSSIREVTPTDAWLGDEGWLDSKLPVLGITVDGGRGVVFYVRRLVAGRWSVDSGSPGHLVGQINAVRPG